MTDSPSAVRVPVLSKTKVWIYPAMLILGGEMQKMSYFLSLLIAKTMPQEIAAGSAAGTATVMISRILLTRILVGTPSFIYKGIVVILPTAARRAIRPTNLILSA